MLRRLTRAGVLALTMAGPLAGCGLFGDEERLEGERIRLREQREAQRDLATAARAEPIPAAVRNSDWTQTNGTASHDSGHLEAPSALTAAWRADVGAGGGGETAITGAPIVLGDRIFALDAEAQLSAFGTSSGNVIWRTSLVPEGEDSDEGFGGGLAAEGDRIFAATGFGEVIAVSAASGEILWRHQAPAPYRAAPAASGGTVVAVTRDNLALALNADTGDLIWRTGGVTADAGLLGGASPAILGNLVVLPFTSGEVQGLDLRTGRPRWSAVLGGARRGLARSAIADVTGDPVIVGRIVVAANQSGRMVAIDGRTGRRGWTRSVGSIGPIWAAGPSIYVVSDAAELLRMSVQSGRTVWRTELPAYDDPEDREDPIAYSGPVLAGGRVLVTDSLGNLLSFDPTTGAQGETVELSDGTTTGPVVAGGSVFVLSDDGTLQAFR